MDKTSDGPEKYERHLDLICRDLRLPISRFDQDWGDSCADRQRVAEFIDFFNHYVQGDPHWVIEKELVDLVLSSGELALAENNQDVVELLRVYVDQHADRASVKQQIQVVASLAECGEMPQLRAQLVKWNAL